VGAHTESCLEELEIEREESVGGGQSVKREMGEGLKQKIKNCRSVTRRMRGIPSLKWNKKKRGKQKQAM